MDYIQAIVLGAVQGLTEFIPVSSSAHLVLTREIFGWGSPGLFFDAILHLGTATAVIFAFWRTWWELLIAVGDMFRTRRFTDTAEKRLVGFLVLGTLPALVIGFLFKDVVEGFFQNIFWIGIFLIISGTAFHAVEFFRRNALSLKLKDLSWWRSLLIGAAQAVALLPGISRSGATIVTAMALKHTRQSAARFSFLLSLPVTLAAGSLGVFDYVRLTEAHTAPVAILPVLLGFAVSAVVGFLAIRGLLRFLKTHSLAVFASYLILIGLIVVVTQLA